jgi:hypothetical protein
VRPEVGKVAMGQDFLRGFPFFLVDIIPSMLHTHLYLHAPLIKKTNGMSLETFQKEMLFGKSREHYTG